MFIVTFKKRFRVTKGLLCDFMNILMLHVCITLCYYAFVETRDIAIWYHCHTLPWWLSYTLHNVRSNERGSSFGLLHQMRPTKFYFASCVLSLQTVYMYTLTDYFQLLLVWCMTTTLIASVMYDDNAHASVTCSGESLCWHGGNWYMSLNEYIGFCHVCNVCTKNSAPWNTSFTFLSL